MWKIQFNSIQFVTILMDNWCSFKALSWHFDFAVNLNGSYFWNENKIKIFKQSYIIYQLYKWVGVSNLSLISRYLAYKTETTFHWRFFNIHSLTLLARVYPNMKVTYWLENRALLVNNKYEIIVFIPVYTTSMVQYIK